MAETLTPEELRRLRSRISMTLCNLREARLYWLPDRHKLVARGVGCVKRQRLPDGALLIGIYSHPMPAQAVVDDLLDLLAVQEASPAAQAGAGGEIEHQEALPHAASDSTR